MSDFKAFTLSAGSMLNQIVTDVLVMPSELFSKTDYQPRMWTAVWDTGATGSCISNRIVRDLNLLPIGKTTIGTANGVIDVNRYLIDIGLPNGVTIKNNLVVCSDFGDDDVIIGMDIITKGDFSITNVNNKTTFSFRIPSIKKIDYTEL